MCCLRMHNPRLIALSFTFEVRLTCAHDAHAIVIRRQAENRCILVDTGGQSTERRTVTAESECLPPSHGRPWTQSHCLANPRLLHHVHHSVPDSKKECHPSEAVSDREQCWTGTAGSITCRSSFSRQRRATITPRIFKRHVSPFCALFHAGHSHCPCRDETKQSLPIECVLDDIDRGRGRRRTGIPIEQGGTEHLCMRRASPHVRDCTTS